METQELDRILDPFRSTADFASLFPQTIGKNGLVLGNLQLLIRTPRQPLSLQGQVLTLDLCVKDGLPRLAHVHKVEGDVGLKNGISCE